MPGRTEYHPAAEEEFVACIQWYLERGRAAAEGFHSTVQKAVELVSAFPEAGPRYLYGTRRVVMSDYPYLLSIVFAERSCRSSPSPILRAGPVTGRTASTDPSPRLLRLHPRTCTLRA